MTPIDDFKLGKRNKPKILGTNEIPDRDPQILDRQSKQEHQAPQVVERHERVISLDDKLRSEKRSPEDPEVRLRSMSPEDRAAWEKARRAET